MPKSSNKWETFYDKDKNNKPLAPESFVARIFLSQSPVKLLKSYNFNNKKNLDIGCGDGRHIHFLQQLEFDTYGVEISRQKTLQLRSKFKNSTFEVSTSKHIFFDDDFFDYVCAFNSIYYLENETDTIYKNLTEACRVLKNGGCFCFTFIGHEHFILKGAYKLPDDSAIIKNDHLNFRNEVRVRPAWSLLDLEHIIKKTGQLDIFKVGEILDRCDGLTRHLYYITAYKNIKE